MNVLDVQHLVKIYGEKVAVEDVSFYLQEGKCTALLGPNGAGKTTTLNMMAGLIKPSRGKITSPLSEKGGDLRTLIGFLPQYPSFYEWMSGEEYLIFVGRLMDIDSQSLKRRIEEIIDLVGLQEGYKRRIGGYSGGMRQRLGIAQALIHRPRLIILDEPVSALDPFGRREVLELLKKLKTETTILFSTHILNDAEEVCDSVLFLNNGKLIERGTIDEVRKRHTDNMLRLTFSETPDDVISLLKNTGWAKTVEVKGNSLWIAVDDVEDAREEFLKLASSRQWPLIKFEVNYLTLEEVFTRVVRG